MTNWREERRPVSRIERLPIDDLATHADADGGRLQILDVRERGEWDAGHITGSVHTPYHAVTEVPQGIDPQRPVAVVCASGQRAAIAARLLARHGATEVIHVVEGGVPAWERAGGATER
ncbi:MAG: hydroxyacylglutathione hydrolase [Solirubrobacteraceae bacterium]|nr:hydroxyacylglutathione hydrolase [Solirubrobacteraceae bacterium]